MTGDEFDAIWLEITVAFDAAEDSPDVRRARKATYATFLQRFSAEQVQYALHRLVEGGQKWRPPPGAIVEAIRAATVGPPPTWAEVEVAVFGRGGVVAASRGHGDLRSGRLLQAGIDAMHERADAAGPWVAAWVRSVDCERLAREEVASEDFGGAVLHRLKGEWAEFAEVAAERVKQGLALEAMGGQRTALEPRKLDTAALLDRLRPAGELGAGS